MGAGKCAQYGCASDMLPLYVEEFDGPELKLYAVSGVGWCNVHGVSEAEDQTSPEGPKRHLGVLVRGKNATRGERVWRWSDGGPRAMMLRGQERNSFYEELPFFRRAPGADRITPVDDLGKSYSVRIRIERPAVATIPAHF